MTKKLSLIITAALAIGFTAPVVQAASANLTAKVRRVLLSSTAYGGCMALLSVSPTTVLPSCSSGWVTFSCDGTFTDQILAYRMLDQAQLAFAGAKNVIVTITDAKKHNGYCLATRIDVY